MAKKGEVDLKQKKPFSTRAKDVFTPTKTRTGKDYGRKQTPTPLNSHAKLYGSKQTASPFGDSPILSGKAETSDPMQMYPDIWREVIAEFWTEAAMRFDHTSHKIKSEWENSIRDDIVAPLLAKFKSRLLSNSIRVVESIWDFLHVKVKGQLALSIQDIQVNDDTTFAILGETLTRNWQMMASEAEKAISKRAPSSSNQATNATPIDDVPMDLGDSGIVGGGEEAGTAFTQEESRDPKTPRTGSANNYDNGLMTNSFSEDDDYTGNRHLFDDFSDDGEIQGNDETASKGLVSKTIREVKTQVMKEVNPLIDGLKAEIKDLLSVIEAMKRTSELSGVGDKATADSLTSRLSEYESKTRTLESQLSMLKSTPSGDVPQTMRDLAANTQNLYNIINSKLSMPVSNSQVTETDRSSYQILKRVENILLELSGTTHGRHSFNDLESLGSMIKNAKLYHAAKLRSQLASVYEGEARKSRLVKPAIITKKKKKHVKSMLSGQTKELANIIIDGRGKSINSDVLKKVLQSIKAQLNQT